MEEIVNFEKVLWALSTIVEASLLVLLVTSKNYRVRPAFFTYILLALLQSVVLFVTYRTWGYSSPVSWHMAWGTQGVVICARLLAVAELCRRVLGRFSGVWALVWRLLVACTAILLLYSILAATTKHQWGLALPAADRGLELTVATVIVVLFLFLRYYGVATAPADRSLAVGFCLYSCFSVLNDTILGHWLDSYERIWNLLGTLAFLASLLLWTWALRKPQPDAVAEQVLLPGGVYQTIMPEVNLRLRMLNEQLGHFLNPEAPRS